MIQQLMHKQAIQLPLPLSVFLLLHTREATCKHVYYLIRLVKPPWAERKTQETYQTITEMTIINRKRASGFKENISSPYLFTNDHLYEKPDKNIYVL